MSQSMSLTKFTAHLCERHSWRHCWGGGTFREHSMSVGVLSSTQGMRHNKGWECSASLQPDETFFFFLILFPMRHLPHLHLAECLQPVPDQSPRPARTEGREGTPRNTGFRRPAGRKGARKLIAEIRE